MVTTSSAGIPRAADLSYAAALRVPSGTSVNLLSPTAGRAQVIPTSG